jgi:predicted phage terminase large subunit-like protein
VTEPILDPATPLTNEQIVQATITPAALGRFTAPSFMGRPYMVYPWLLHMERQLLTMMMRPGPEVMIVSVPPQQGKSTYCSLFLPVWYLGHNPSNQVINISYSEEQASKWGEHARNLIKLWGPSLFGVSLNPDSDSKTKWKLGNGFGGMMSTGIRGGITGNPGHLILLDDTLKGREDANSPTIKRKNIEEWHDSITSRFQNDSKVLIVATRWCEDDLSGLILEESRRPGYKGYPIHEMNIKAIAEPDPPERKVLENMDRANDIEPGAPGSALAAWRDVLGRSEGETLPGQHRRSFFFLAKASRPTARWNALYQGTPGADDDGMFPESRWRFWVYDDYDGRPPETAILPELARKVRVWDLAASEDDGDWTVGTLMARSVDDRFFVLDVQRFRHAPGRVHQIVRQTAEEDGFTIPIRIERERSGAGITVVDDYKRELLGWDVDGIKAEGDKTQRAGPWSRIQNSHKAYLPSHADWIDRYTGNHAQMDGKGGLPRFDDEIDTSAYAATFLLTGGTSQIWDPTGLGDTEGLTDDEILDRQAFLMQLGLG